MVGAHLVADSRHTVEDDGAGSTLDIVDGGLDETEADGGRDGGAGDEVEGGGHVGGAGREVR